MSTEAPKNEQQPLNVRTRAMVEKYDGPAPQEGEDKLPVETIITERVRGQLVRHEIWKGGVLVQCETFPEPNDP